MRSALLNQHIAQDFFRILSPIVVSSHLWLSNDPPQGDVSFDLVSDTLVRSTLLALVHQVYKLNALNRSLQGDIECAVATTWAISDARKSERGIFTHNDSQQTEALYKVLQRDERHLNLGLGSSTRGGLRHGGGGFRWREREGQGEGEKEGGPPQVLWLWAEGAPQ